MPGMPVDDEDRMQIRIARKDRLDGGKQFGRDEQRPRAASMSMALYSSADSNVLRGTGMIPAFRLPQKITGNSIWSSTSIAARSSRLRPWRSYSAAMRSDCSASSRYVRVWPPSPASMKAAFPPSGPDRCRSTKYSAALPLASVMSLLPMSGPASVPEALSTGEFDRSFGQKVKDVGVSADHGRVVVGAGRIDVPARRLPSNWGAPLIGMIAPISPLVWM